MIITTPITRLITAPGNKRQQAGLSLVELMVALALGLVVVAAMTTLFVNVSRSNQEMAKTNSQIENARFAMQFLGNDIFHAGFWNEYIPDFDDLSLDIDIPPDHYPRPIPVGNTLATPDSCLAYSAWPSPEDGGHVDQLLAVPLEVHAGVPGRSCTAALLPDKVADTDLLIVRHAEPCVPGETNCDDDEAGQLYFQASNCRHQLEDKDYYVLGTSGFDMYDKDCLDGSPITGLPTAKRLFIQNIYYIRSWTNKSDEDPKIPALVRSEFTFSGGTLSQKTPVALVPGIERFRVELAFDDISDSGDPVENTTTVNWADVDNRDSPTNRGDGVPDGGYVHCPSAPAGTCSGAQLANTVALRMYILARADQESPGYKDEKVYTLGGLTVAAQNDGFKRHVFSTSMRLHSIAGRRETP
ncbi:MAG: PilW family protein [Halioglobus sp.]